MERRRSGIVLSNALRLDLPVNSRVNESLSVCSVFLWCVTPSFRAGRIEVEWERIDQQINAGGIVHFEIDDRSAAGSF